MSRRTTVYVLAALVLVLALVLTARAATLPRQLELGMSGSDVSSLQTFLAGDPTIYPQGLVTGYFGPLTKAAVIQFQLRNGIDPVGRVGPITLAAINAQMANGTGSDSAAIITNVGLTSGANSAIVHWTTNEPARGTVYYSNAPMPMSETLTDVTIVGNSTMTDTALHNQQDVTLSGLQGNTTYYYVIYTKDAMGNVQMTWPATFKTQ